MIPKIVWCLFITFFIGENNCSPTERDLYAFTTVVNANAEQSTTHGKEIQDPEAAETKTHFSEDDRVLKDSTDDPPGPPDHVVPYSEHENPEEVPTRPKYVAPGVWAKPDPKKKIPLDFIPTKTLAQVRGTHTVKILPQSEAIAAATSAEEKENAPRLREVVSKKKTNTIYTEEGYEDSAYDHGGHIRDADFHEGYAKKLHDQRQSKARSGAARKKKSKKKKKKKKKDNLKNESSRREPEEFDEFTDDYRDEHSPNESYESEESSESRRQSDENKRREELWKEPEVNPKIVTENEIEKLEDDLRREAEEVEKGSENYESSIHGGRDSEQDNESKDTEERRLSSSKSESSRKVPKNSDSSSSNEDEFEVNSRRPSSKTKERFYNENYEATTLQFETPTPRESEPYKTSTFGYENPTTIKYYFPEGSALENGYETTTFDSVKLNNPQSESSTNMNYGELFWNYYKNNPNEATSPQPEEQNTPVALATINGHGPYLLLSQNEEVTQNPNQFVTESATYYPTTQADIITQTNTFIQNGHQPVNSNLFSNQEYQLVNSQVATARSGYDFPSFFDSGIPTTSIFDNWGFSNGGYSSLESPTTSTESPTTRFYDSIAFSSTPTYSIITPPSKEYNPSIKMSQRISSYRKNPLLDSNREEVEKNDYKNFDMLYKGWPTEKKNSPSNIRGQLSFEDGSTEKKPSNSESHGGKGMSFFEYTPDLKYKKILNFLKSQQSDRYNRQKSESANAEDFTIMKPPASREFVFSDFTLSSYPNVADYSSGTQESEAAQEANGKQFHTKNNNSKYKDLSQNNLHFKSPTFNGGNTLATTGVNRKKLFPASKLLPPSPYSKDNYADQNFANWNNEHYQPTKYFSSQSDHKPDIGNGVKNYNPDPKKLALYLTNRRLPTRNSRSTDKVTLTDDEIRRYNFTFGDQGSTQYRDLKELRKSKLRVRRNLEAEESRIMTKNSQLLRGEIFSNENENDSKIHITRSLRNKRSHQNLLDASHKIAGDVIDEEINARFKEKKRRDKTHEDNEEEEEYDDEDDEENEDEQAKREKQVEVEVPDFDYLDEIEHVNNIENIPTTTKASIDFEKYPFYKNAKVANLSPLKYIINPKDVPKKTFGGMEFYESRDKYVQCDEVDPNLDEVIPEDEEPVPNRGPKQNLPRLRGLGDKLDCFKAKYFGENPFDNPLFFEKQINQPSLPSDFDPMKFAARISELPKENTNYVVRSKSRKPETVSIKRMDDGRQPTESPKFAAASNVQNSTAALVRRRKKNDRNNLKVSSTEQPPSKILRTRKRKPVQNLQPSTTERIETSPVTPYEKEVYDDVMGTIKNMASFYEMFDAQTASPVTETTIVSPNSGRIPNRLNTRNPRNRGKNFRPISLTQNPFYEQIDGMIPPPEFRRIPKISPYRTNKVSYNTRPRIERPVRSGDKKIIGYFRTVMVHKRSLDDNSDARNEAEIDSNKRVTKKWDVSDLEFEESQADLRTVNPSSSPSPTVGQDRKRRRKINLATATTTTVASITSDAGIETQNGTRKPVYTIRTRPKNSKDEKSIDKQGTFTTTRRISTTTDGRRKEPRYSEIIRSKNRSVTSSTTETNMKKSVKPEQIKNPETNETSVEKKMEKEEIFESENSAPRSKKVNIGNSKSFDEIYNAMASDLEPEHTEEEEEDLENYEEESTDEPEKEKRKYDVHEDVQEDTTPSTVDFSKPAKISEHVDLESFLRSDPPGYSNAFPSELTTRAEHVNPDKLVNEKDNYRDEESKDEKVEEEDEEYQVEPQNESHQEEESSDEEDIDYPRDEKSNKNSLNKNADDSGNERNSSELEESGEKTFFRYNARPPSPSENFEDEKYADLGPRINKPAFHHPFFEPPKHEGNFFDDTDKDEKDKSNESLEKDTEYVFPWAHDEEDEKAEAREAYVEQATEKYEYPWEKRERLAEERKRRRKERERLKKLRDFSFFHDDDDEDDSEEDEDEKKASSSDIYGKSTYPWELYDVPSKATRKKSFRNRYSDSDELSSENRPVAKFSSKYSSRNFKLPFPGSEPIKTAQPDKIRESVLKYLQDADKKSSVEPTVAYETDISTTSNSEKEMNIFNPVEKKVTTNEPLSSGSKNTRRISNSRIIPENITTAPRKVNRTRITSVKDRTTLRPVVRSNNEGSKAQTTTLPSTSTRRPLRLRGRSYVSGQQPSYKVQEIVSTTTSTTEKPVDLSTKTSRKVFTRKRENSKNILNTTENYDNSTPATKKIRRRKRPTISTQATITKTVVKNDEKPKTTSRINTRNYMKEMTFDSYRNPPTTSVNSRNRNLENSTPTSRTVEHSSRVSKEEIITQTSFPDQDVKYEMYKNKNTTKKISPFNRNSDNLSSNNRKSKLIYSKTPDRSRISLGAKDSEKENSEKNESVEKLSITTKETPEHVYQAKEIIDSDGLKGMFLSITPKNRTIGPSAMEDELHLRKTAMDNFGKTRDEEYNFDESKTKNSNSNEDTGSTLSEDSLVLNQLLQKIPPPPSNPLKETDDGGEESSEEDSSEEDSSEEYEDRHNGYKERDDSEEVDSSEEKRSSALKFEKDPSRRLYYYLENKK